ncbi:hypothetical protein EYC56_00295 [Xanthomonas oryzae]|nr:hypothetical protein EYC56_00295 [Xanthomonas oryzae]
MICSSEKRFFTSNLLGIENWTPNRCATQNRGDVGAPNQASSSMSPCNPFEPAACRLLAKRSQSAVLPHVGEILTDPTRRYLLPLGDDVARKQVRARIDSVRELLWHFAQKDTRTARVSQG